MRPFEIFDHTADVGLIVRGANLPELFINAALGLNSLLIDPSTVFGGALRERIRAEASDKDALLVNWLNEIISLFSVQKMVFSRFEIKDLSDRSYELPAHLMGEKFGESRGWVIEAEGQGELLDPGRHSILREVKAATFHELEIKQNPEGWEARIIFDV